MPNRNETPSALLAAGRGLEIYDFPVALEPLIPSGFQARGQNHPSHRGQVIDDGRHPGLLESLFQRRTSTTASVQTPNVLSVCGESSAFVPKRASVCPMTELQVSLPQTSIVTPELTERLLLNLANRSAPTALEIIGTPDEIQIQLAVRETDAEKAERHIKAHFHESWVSQTKNHLSTLFQSRNFNTARYPLIIDFGLRRQVLRPLNTLRSFEPDPLIGLISGLSDLQSGESCVFQVLFQTIGETWRERFIAELTDKTGKPRFMESKELLTIVNQKFSRPLLAVSVRLGVIASHRERALEISRGLAGIFQTLANPNGNEVMALQSRDISPENKLSSFINRTTHRSGMLLNVSELAGLAHLPSASVRSPKLKREELKSKSSPKMASGHQLILGQNSHQGKVQPVTLSNEQRSRHMHLIGSSGSGKSTLLLNLIRQDLKQNQGLCVIDPHGDLVDEVIANVPEERTKDVVLFDASDSEYPIGFNILQANSDVEKTILSSDLTATFRRMATSWGDVMDSVLANAVLAFVESKRGGTLFELKRFLVEKTFRSEFLETVDDEAIRYFWRHEFPLIAGKPQASILIRLDTFLRQKLVRNIVCQKETKLNFRDIMDNGKVLLIKLSQGLIGEENAYLLGTLLVSKLYQTALTRQDTDVRPYFWLYLDEFHHFITPSMEGILSGTRKYHLGLALAHQEFRQLQSRNQEVASSVLSNCYTRICFRLGDTDAERFASGFSFFDSKSLQNQGIGEAIVRIERAEHDFNLKVAPVSKVDDESAEKTKDEVLSLTRRRYATPREEVEAEMFANTANKTVVENVGDSSEIATINPEAPKTRKTKQSREMGNQEHLYLQSIIKRVAESYGFVSVIEKSVFGGIGRVDVALENQQYKIACEIAVTNTVDYELQNIQKCLASGFDRVVVISPDTKHLDRIRKKVEISLEPEQFSKIQFLEPENFHLFLEALANLEPQQKLDVERVKGYEIKTRFKETSQSDIGTREKVVQEILSNALRRKRPSND